MLQFNFDANAGETPASVAQKRALVAQILGTAKSPSNVGEGFSAIGDGIVANVLGGRAAEAEKAGQASADDTFAQLVASITGQGAATPSYTPQAATASPSSLPSVSPFEYTAAGLPRDPDTGYLMAEDDPRYAEAVRLYGNNGGSADASYIRQGLINRGLPEHVADAFLLNMQDESGLNPGINEASPTVPGSRGGFGLYQLTGPRRVAYEQYAQQLGVDPSNVDAQLDFMMSELQGPEARAYQSIMAAPDTGSAAAAIVNDFLRPAEEHRARRAAQYTGGAPTQVAQGPDLAMLMEAASNPWLSDSQKSVINSMIAQQMQQQDPAYQQGLRAGDLGIQKAELELEALRNKPPPLPDAPKTEKIYDPATGQEIVVQWNGQTWEPLGGAKGDEPTSNMRDYEAYAADERAAGREPLNRLQYEQEVRKAGASNITTNVGGEQTPGWKKIDETFAETYLDWNSGGWADTQKQLEQLGESLDILENGGDVTGAIGMLPREMGAFFNPDGTIARENVEEVVQRSLREILGAQFTEKEGERLIARAFNPLLSPAENTKRVKRLLTTIQGMAESKQGMVDYFDQNGTLRGYQGTRVKPSDIDRLADEFGKAPGEDEAAPLSQSQAVPGIEDLVQKYLVP
jgi:hypothetical protein